MKTNKANIGYCDADYVLHLELPLDTLEHRDTQCACDSPYSADRAPEFECECECDYYVSHYV